MKKLIFTVLISAGCAHAQSPEGCADNPELYRKKSAELERIEKEDQADRTSDYKKIDWTIVGPRDRARRMQVAAIFAQGCFKEPKDYQRAALVFQHGDVPDHFYQTFIWASAAVKMGDFSQSSLVALGIDRYLVKIGQKQLFGSQFSLDNKGQWCIETVEPTFPEALRLKYLHMSLYDHEAFFLKANNSVMTPSDVKDCDHALKPSPAGTVPGFW